MAEDRGLGSQLVRAREIRAANIKAKNVSSAKKAVRPRKEVKAEKQFTL
jgi:hypothetical protein